VSGSRLVDDAAAPQDARWSNGKCGHHEVQVGRSLMAPDGVLELPAHGRTSTDGTFSRGTLTSVNTEPLIRHDTPRATALCNIRVAVLKFGEPLSRVKSQLPELAGIDHVYRRR